MDGALQRFKEVVARTGPPLTDPRIWHAGGNFPIGLKATEVIDSQQVAQLERTLDASHPPFVTSAFMYIPTVKRIAPALS